MTGASEGKRDFFVSFTQADRAWASWIAWTLEEAGYSVWFQDWDFTGNFVLEMDRAHRLSRRTIVVLSPAYLASQFAASEWAARFAEDATSEHDLLIPVRVQPGKYGGLLAQVAYVDLVGCAQAAAREKLLGRVQGIRLKPDEPPLFPGEPGHRSVLEPPVFPPATWDTGRPATAWPQQLLPWLRCQAEIFFAAVLNTREFFSEASRFGRDKLGAALGYLLFLSAIPVLLSIPTEFYVWGRDALSSQAVAVTLFGNIISTVIFAVVIKLALLAVFRNVDVARCFTWAVYAFSFFLLYRPVFFVSSGLIHGYFPDERVADLMLGAIPNCAFTAIPLWSLLFFALANASALILIQWKLTQAIRYQFGTGLGRSLLAGILASSMLDFVTYTSLLPFDYQPPQPATEAAGTGTDRASRVRAAEAEPNDRLPEANRIEIAKAYEGRVRGNEIDLFAFDNASGSNADLRLTIQKVSGYGCIDVGVFTSDRKILQEATGYKTVKMSVALDALGRYFILVTLKNASVGEEYWRYVLEVDRG